MSDFQPAYQKRLQDALKPKRFIFPFGVGIMRVFKTAFKNLFRPHIVVQYPQERYELPKIGRAHV
jgi:formate hydrogenlyase subunit 6/NADH:ubiquinone oxidoreductase subunit I